MDCWIIKTSLSTQTHTHTHLGHLDNFPENFISTFLELTSVLTLQSYVLQQRVCDAADNKEQLKCL